MAETQLPPRGSAETSADIRREIVQLVALTIVALCAFFLTRAVAAANRVTGLRDAARWFEKGRAGLAEGRIDAAIDSFRRAVARNRTEQRYGLALAGALAAEGQDASARQVLLSLRESAPDEPEINLQLARLAAKAADVGEAVRYYHNALYAPRTSEHPQARRQVRVELVHFLLAQRLASRALSELLALSAELPDEAGPRVEAGQLFSRAGDERRALDQFQHALRIVPSEQAALAGAGLAAASLGNYGLAEKYLASASAEMNAVKETREMVEAVLSRDPLSPHLRFQERARRVRENLSYAADRFRACRPRGSEAPAPQDDADLPLRDAARTFEAKQMSGMGGDQEALEQGVELASRLAVRLQSACPPATPLDLALIAIGRRHGIVP